MRRRIVSVIAPLNLASLSIKLVWVYTHHNTRVKAEKLERFEQGFVQNDHNISALDHFITLL